MTTSTRTAIAAGLKYTTSSYESSGERTRERERATEKAREKKRERVIERREKAKKMQMRTSTKHNLHAHDRQEEKRNGGCVFARSSIVRDSFLRASAQAQMAMYVSR
jgi:hypothetical protein